MPLTDEAKGTVISSRVYLYLWVGWAKADRESEKISKKRHDPE